MTIFDRKHAKAIEGGILRKKLFLTKKKFLMM